MLRQRHFEPQSSVPAALDASGVRLYLQCPMTTLFISDLHLDAERPEITELFGEFIDREARDADALLHPRRPVRSMGRR